MSTKDEAVVRLPLTTSAAGEAGAPGPSSPHGVTREMIAAVVDDFYATCRADPTVGPIFNARIHDWDTHLATIRGFWASALLRTGEYAGRPLHAHLAIPGLEPRHFSVWLRLFRETLQRHCSPQAEAAFMDAAGMMARHMMTVIAGRQREVPDPRA